MIVLSVAPLPIPLTSYRRFETVQGMKLGEEPGSSAMVGNTMTIALHAAILLVITQESARTKRSMKPGVRLA